MSLAFARIPREVLAEALKRVEIDLDPSLPNFDHEAARAVSLIVRGDEEQWHAFRQFFDATWQSHEATEFPIEPGQLELTAKIESDDGLEDIDPTGFESIDAQVAVSKGTVMVVDDSATMRIFMRGQLEHEGYSVVLATDAWDALGQLESWTTDRAPAMLFVDVMMPRMNGFQLVQLIQQRDGFENLPVVMMTAGSINEWQGKMAGIQASALLSKPLDQSAVRAQLERNLPMRANS